jgi:hypothetical protein
MNVTITQPAAISAAIVKESDITAGIVQYTISASVSASPVYSAVLSDQGAQGVPGPTGPTGPTGATGPQGSIGPQGIKGDTGLTGLTGPQGNAGTNGTNGTDGKTVRNGSGVPSGGLGVDGDFYIDTVAGNLYGPKTGGAWGSATSIVQGATGAQGPQGIQGIQGTTGATGPQGPAGATGAQGIQGPAGAQGIQGPKGDDGAAGAAGSAGATGPQGPKGDDGAAGATGPQGAQGIQGVQGPTGATGSQGPAGSNGTNGTNGVDGRTVYNGSGAPSSGLGAAGDFYIDTSVGNIHGPKTTVWPSGVSLIGPAGATGAAGSNGTNGTNGSNGVDGKTVRSGSGVPDSGLGVDGDFYINTAANTIYGPKTSGSWGSSTSIVGPQGSQGTQGIQGIQGATGAAGSDASVTKVNVEAVLTGEISSHTHAAGAVSRAQAECICSDFYSANANTIVGITGAANSSGSITLASAEANHPGMVVLRDSTTANGGYYFMTSAQAYLIAGGETCMLIFKTSDVRSTAHWRFGFQDSTATQTQPTDGIWIQSVGNGSTVSIFGRCKNNAGPSDTSTYQLTTATWYTAVITVNSDATSVNFQLFSEAGSSLWSQNVTGNIPVGSGRHTGWGILAGESTTDAAADLITLDYTIMGINRTLTR